MTDADEDQKAETNGFVERFTRIVLDEFFRRAFRGILYESVEALQQGPRRDLDKSLLNYNTERTHQGYRNVGRRPIEWIEEFLQNVRQEA